MKCVSCGGKFQHLPQKPDGWKAGDPLGFHCHVETCENCKIKFGVWVKDTECLIKEHKITIR